MEYFKNPHDALMFALRFSSQQYAQSPMSKQMRHGGATIGQGKGLVALDGAATAGIIRSRIEQLTPLQRACIIARFSERVETCPCCGNDKALDGYKGALLTLANWAAAFVTSEVAGQRLLYAIVQEYFERRKAIGKDAIRLGVPKRTAYDQKGKIWPHLANLDKTAMTAAGAALEDLIGEIA